VPAGLDNIAYNINTVTLDNSYPVVTFRVLKNNVPIVFNKYTGPLDNVTRVKAFVDNGLITGYTGSPSFIVAWAADQDGVNPVADYNNLGVVQLFGTTVKGQGQPVTVSIAEIFLNDNTAGIIQSGPDGSGYYTVKLSQQVSRNSSTGVITDRYSAQNPLGSYMRAVALQGRVSQLVGGVAVRRPATSVVKEVTGDTVRRVVVSKDACLGCHKQLALHGSNRVNEVQVCVTCHNPNLGQKISSTATSVSWNMKDMVHGIHAASSTYGEFEEVTYPAQLKHCTKCHIGDTYKTELPDGVLLSTDTRIGAAPGLQDNVNSPLAAACGRCHNPNTELKSPSTVYDHYKLMGGDVGATREVADLVAPPYPLAPVFMGP
jgi:OmcA/MtrC family decaheme c-type cytochrome